MKTLTPISFGLCYVLSAHFVYGYTCIGNLNSWMMSGNQSPCDLYQSLIRLCIPTFVVTSLAYGQQYPTGEEACGCNTVAASLVAACSDCMNSATYDGPLYSWYLTFNSGGTNHCSSITNGSISTTVSVPSALRGDIPTWAFIDINIFGGYWSYANAHTVAYGGALTPTLTTDTASQTGTATTVTISPTSSTTSNGVPIGAVVGGVVGGVALLVIAVLLVLFWMRRRRRAAAKKAAEKADLTHGEIPAMSYYPQGDDSPTTPNYPKVDSTLERASRPGVIEHHRASSTMKLPDSPTDTRTLASAQGSNHWSGLYPASISPTFVGPEHTGLTYSPPPPPNAHENYQPSDQQTDSTPPPGAGPGTPPATNPITNPPGYKSSYNH